MAKRCTKSAAYRKGFLAARKQHPSRSLSIACEFALDQFYMGHHCASTASDVHAAAKSRRELSLKPQNGIWILTTSVAMLMVWFSQGSEPADF